MKTEYQPRDYRKDIERALKILKSSNDISEKNKNLILRYHDACFAEGLMLGTVANQMWRLKFFLKYIKKDLEDVKKEDIAYLVKEIECSSYSETFKISLKASLKKFYKWLRGTGDYPEEVKWINTNLKARFAKLPEDILTEEEIQKMVQVAGNPRDKAIIGCLYESGCRAGEILSIRIRNVQFDKYGARLKVKGKTGERVVRTVAFTSLLATWIESHPLKDDPDALLWTSIGTRNNGNCICYAALVEILKRVAIKAHIKKAINPHAFRHARATHLAKHLTEIQLRQYFGWTKESCMTSVYVHLSGRDIEKALLSTYGIVEKEEQTLILKPKICSRCKNSNSPDSDLCGRCGLPLNPNTIIDLDAKRDQANELMTALMKDKETRDAIMKGVTRLGLQDKVINL